MANPKWFDADVYMQNKLVQMQASDPAYTMTDLVDAFAKAGYVGPEGYYAHFVQYGADEDVAPNAFFNAQEYYTAKAAQYYGEAFTGSELQVAEVKALIQAADMNAWTHYQQYGSAEGVDPSNAFDASAYCAAKALAMNDAGLKDAAGNDWTADSIKTAIDQAGMSVLEHYLTYAGTGEGEVAAGSTYPVADEDQVPNPGETVVVDGTATTYTGTAGDDTFYVDTKAELQEYNTLDGGEGNDTLVLNSQAQAGTIKNIENLVVRNATTVETPYDLSAFSSSFTLDGGSATVKNVTSQKLIADGATSLTVNMAAGQTSVDLTSQDRATQALTVALSGDSLTSVKLAVDEGANDVAFTGSTAKVTDLAITATTSAAEDDAAMVDVDGLTELTNITVAGAGAVELTVGAANAALETVNATDNTGGVTVDLSEADKAAFTGSAGDDTLTVKGSTVAHTLGAGDDTVVVKDDALEKGFSVDGGEGTDTLAMSADLAKGFADADAVAAVATNFEILQLTGNSSESAVDMGNFGGIDHVVVGEGSWGEKLTLNDMANGGTLEYAADNTNGVEVVIKDATEGKTDVLNVTIAADGEVAAGTLTVADVETIKITADDTKLDADGKADTHTMTLTADAATTVNISGNAGLNLTLTGSDAITKIDASGNTGGLTVDLSGFTSGITVTGSSADDEITLGFNGKVNGNGGDDTFKVTASSDGELDSSYSTIEDFDAGDTLFISGANAVVSAGTLVENTLEQAVTSAMTKDAADTAVSFTWGNDTYVVYDAGQNGSFDTNDFLVKLAGVTGVEFEADGAGNLSLA